MDEKKLWQLSSFVLESWKDSNSIVETQIASYNNFLHVILPQIIAEYGSFSCIADNKSKAKHSIRITNVHYRHPEIMEGSGRIFRLSPFECLQRKLDYMAQVLVDITHTVESEAGGTHENKFYEHHLFDLPVMVLSDLCRLRQNEHFMAQESLYEFGGHFIISGSEKILVQQEKLRVNYPFVSLSKKANRNIWTCEVRSWTEEKFRSTSTSYFSLHDKKGLCEVKVKLPFLEKTEIPLVLVFRMLGIDNPQAYIPTHPAIEALLRNILTDHGEHGYATWTLNEIYEHVALKGIKELAKNNTPEKRQKYVSHIMLNEFLPHEPNKGLGLGLIIWEMLMTVKGVFEPGDRDAFYNKRLHTAGPLMALQLRILLRQYLKGVQLTLQKNIDSGRYTEITDYMSWKKVTAGIKYALSTGRWGVPKGANKGGQDGTAQVYSRLNYEASVSHARRANTPLNRESKQAKPRQVRSSHYGLLCAVETPEGASCGLVESLTTLAHVRLGGTAQIVQRVIRSLFGPLLRSPDTGLPGADALTFLFNGTLLGYLPIVGQNVVKELRLMRRCMELPFDTSIAWDPLRKQIRVNTDLGAVLRPLFVLENIPKLAGLAERYQYDPCFFRVLLSEGVIEYLDKEEEELNATIAMDWRGVGETTTHLDIYPGVILGLSAGIIPFPEHNQAPRNIYGTIQGKQGAGIPLTNHYDRFETASHVLNHVERPIVTTQIGRIFDHDALPAGINCVVAIMSGSYNQEDSNIINKSFLDMGYMQSTVYHTYVGEERLSSSDREVFGKPTPTEVVNIQKGNYEFLNDMGFAPPGTKIPGNQQGTAIIGKMMSTLQVQDNPEDNKPRDRSLLLFPNREVTVDRVLRTVGSEGNVILKVRTRSNRIPEIGDKFAATCGQKNTCGMIRAPEDMPFSAQSGITPDIIINPHCVPSRMTIGLLLEMLLGKTACLEGRIGDGTPFKEITSSKIGEVLHKHGYQSRGHEALIDGTTGELYPGCQIFMGPCFYQRLKHMTEDKIHARFRGPLQLLSRQPSEGRSRAGGLKFGEMEVDAGKTHGVASFVNDRLRENSDKFSIQVCGQCGNMVPSSIPEEKAQLLGPLFSTEVLCPVCESSASIYTANIAYASKLLLQELQALNFGLRLFPKEV